ncbi:MAG: protoporphyrinogen oxidase HemJ [Beijerinckiaceae bacterium]|nr:protoporphyrinogen oxidase HemJ [Beijerinckiaceae bacterium]
MFVWIKVLHVLAIISWMAGLLYLPRLFVYHVEAAHGSIQSETFKVMERRLYRAIMTPAMVVAWATGIALIWYGGFISDGWLQAKLIFVIALTASHFHMGRIRRSFGNDANMKPQRYFRILNELPTILMIGIVIFVIAKPF